MIVNIPFRTGDGRPSRSMDGSVLFMRRHWPAPFRLVGMTAVLSQIVPHGGFSGELSHPRWGGRPMRFERNRLGLYVCNALFDAVPLRVERDEILLFTLPILPGVVVELVGLANVVSE